MRVLNLYAGIGGNRKLWTDCEVTAVEIREDIAAVYADHFPEDTLVIGDAHEYLLQHYKEFDFIWTSTPCPSHSRARFWRAKGDSIPTIYPDMKLYQEIILLNNYFDGLWSSENVTPFYEPLIQPTIKLGRHLFWSNFNISKIDTQDADIQAGNSKEWSELHGFDLSGYKIETRKDQIYRNCVHPETGLHIMNCALKKETRQRAQRTIW